MLLAAYKGDAFLEIADSYEEMAIKLNKDIENIKWLSYKTAHNRDKTYSRVLIYKYDTED